MSEQKFITHQNSVNKESVENDSKGPQIVMETTAGPSNRSVPEAKASNSEKSLAQIQTVADNEPNKEPKLVQTKTLGKRKIPVSAVIKLLIPISIAMLLVVLYVKLICECNCHGPALKAPLRSMTARFGKKGIDFSAAVLISLILITSIVVVTFIVYLCYHYRFYKVMNGYMKLVFLMVFLLLASMVFKRILVRFNIALDYMTACLLFWNYVTSGMASIFWKGPLILQKAFLINMTVLVSINFLTVLPEWTIWLLLIFLVIWDLVAVLTPCGPLKLLAETNRKRRMEESKDDLPAGLLYSTIIWFPTLIALNTIPENKENGKNSDSNDSQTTGESQGPKLGLGDFVFYSILMGKATEYGDFNLVAGCYVGILFGFLLTLVLLVVYQRPLPALPISITLGLIIFAVSYYCLTPYLNYLSYNSIFI